MIKEQLEDYCSCVCSIEDKNIDELINVISKLTCWSNKDCGTFLLENRREVIELPKCTECMYEFKPFYKPYQVESFNFTLVKQKDGIEELIPLEAVYSEIDEVFRLDLNMSCACSCKTKCKCNPKYKLLVEYVAGYEEIPSCILPIFCDVLSMISNKNDCENGCSTCNKGEEDANVIFPGGDILSVRIKQELERILRNTYMSMLEQISLCDNKELWTVVV